MRERQRVTVYGICRSARHGGGVVLVRASDRSDVIGSWSLPGGGLDHGEAPAAALVREFAEETGLVVRVGALRDVYDDVLDVAHRGTRVHTVRLVYDVVEIAGDLRPEVDGTTDQVDVVGHDDADDLPLLPFTARALGLSTPPSPVVVPPRRPMPAAASNGAMVMRQRVAAYALVVADHHVLLTRLSGTTPVPGLWTLPGGGIDHGESVRDALAREVWEEAGLRVDRPQLLAVLSDRFIGTSPTGVEEDFHGVPIIFAADAVRTDAATLPQPRVTEVDGTTDAAAWIPLRTVGGVGLTRSATAALRLVPAAGMADPVVVA